MTKIKQVTVVGAGSMGHGIGQEFAAGGYKVVIYDIDEKKLDSAKKRIKDNLLELSKWKIYPSSEVEPTTNRIRTTTSLDDAAEQADLVVEAVFENLEIKQQVFRDLDRICSQRTILASNTSTLMPSSLASVTNRPDRVLVTHFYNPPYLMPLVEVARSELTSDKTVEIVYNLLKSMGKRPVILQKEILGFIATRLQIALFREAFCIVERGVATPQDVDLAVKNSFGRRLPVAGPFEMCEFNDGWDQIEQISNYVYSDLASSDEFSPIIKKMINRNELGVKSGKGFYDWSPENTERWRKRMAENLMKFLNPISRNNL
jgi:3-hydroxybutyryl-CoA dehydrogenase